MSVCVYHAGCVDGLASASIMQKKYGCIRLVGCPAGSDPDINIHNESVFFVDIAPSHECLMDLLNKGNTVTVIDHHVTSHAALKNVVHPNFVYIYSANKCGCLLTHEYVSPGVPVPEYLKYIDDQDRFVRVLENTEEITSAIYSDYKSIPGMALLEHVNMTDLVTRGTFLKQVNNKNISDAIANRIECTYKNMHCYVYSDYSNMRSMTGSQLLDIPMTSGVLPDFTVFYRYDLRSGKLYVSLRGRDDRVACSEIAAEFGGGGHRNACGFELDPSVPLNSVFKVI